MIVVLVQLDAAEQPLGFLQRFVGDQRFQGDGSEERGAADAGQQADGGRAVLHGIQHADVHLFRFIDLVIQHHMGDGVVGFHLAGEQMLAAVGIVKGRHAQIQRYLHCRAVGSGGEAQQGTHHLPDAAVVVVHIGQRLIKIGVFVQRRFIAEGGRLIVHKIFQVDIQRLRDLVQRLNVDGDGSVFILGQRSLTLVDHGGELLDGITAAFPIFFDAMPDEVGKRTHPQRPPFKCTPIIPNIPSFVNKKFLNMKLDLDFFPKSKRETKSVRCS